MPTWVSDETLKVCLSCVPEQKAETFGDSEVLKKVHKVCRALDPPS